MGKNVTQKLIERHLVAGRAIPGEAIALRIDQTLTQDATGTQAMLEFEAMGIPRIRTELSVQYVDHNLLQEDARNALTGRAVGMVLAGSLINCVRARRAAAPEATADMTV